MTSLAIMLRKRTQKKNMYCKLFSNYGILLLYSREQENGISRVANGDLNHWMHQEFYKFTNLQIVVK